MPSKPIVAVVIPSFNQGHFIRQTIDSILHQQGVKVDVLVMDGGSKDSTVEILKSYKNKITWISKKDKGQSDAINKGLKKFLSKYRQQEVYFAYLNSDDYYLPGALERAVTAFNANPSRVWLVGDCQIVESEGREIQEPIRGYKRWWRMLLSWPILLVLNPIPQPAVFMKLSAARQTGLFNQELHFTMDYEYWLRLWKDWGRPVVITDALAAFRIHGQSKGSTSFHRQFAEQYRVARDQGAPSHWLFLQSMHNSLITTVYNLIK